MDGDDDFVAVAGQRFVDGVVHHLEHQVMQAGAVRGITDVHAGALAHSFQAFENLNGATVVQIGVAGAFGGIAFARRTELGLGQSSGS